MVLIGSRFLRLYRHKIRTYNQFNLNAARTLCPFPASVSAVVMPEARTARASWTFRDFNHFLSCLSISPKSHPPSPLALARRLPVDREIDVRRLATGGDARDSGRLPSARERSPSQTDVGSYSRRNTCPPKRIVVQKKNCPTRGRGGWFKRREQFSVQAAGSR